MKVFLRFIACLALLAAAAWAQTQNLFVMPGNGSTAQNVLVYSPQPFAPGTGFVAGAGTFKVVAKPDGSKYYAIANSGSQTVTVIDSGFANPKSLGNPGLQAGNAVITPDGTKLFVAAGSLLEYETTGDTNTGTISMGPAVSVFDDAISLDGTRVFTLGSVNAGGSQLNALDVASNRVAGSLSIPGNATAVAVGPNGMVYVTTQNEILEVDPVALTVTPGGTIQLNARPGRPAFTPDGKYLVAPNLTPITGTTVLFIDLTSRSLAGNIPNSSVPNNVVFDRILPASSTTLYAFSSTTQALFTLTIGSGPSFSVSAYAIPGINGGSVSAATISNEVPGAGLTTVNYLFVVQNGTLYRVDLNTNSTTGQFPLPTSNVGSAMSYAGAAYTAGPVTTLVQYGGGQTVVPGQVSHPIVVRALDANGHALSGITITWAANVSTASVSPVSSTTGADGYAITYLTAPPTSGIVTVTGTAGTQTAAFSIGVGSVSGGSAGGLQIISGQGQILFENFNTSIPGFGSSLIVAVTDVNAKPVSGATVTFAVTQGPGSLTGGTATGAPGAVSVTTDANGQASVGFLSSTIVGNGTGFTQTTVNASAPGTNSVNFYMTTTQRASPPLVQLRKPNIGDTITGQAGTTTPGAVVVQVTSTLGQSIPNVSVQVSNGGLDPKQFPNATCADPTGNGLLTDANGLASCDLQFNGHTGTVVENALVGYFQNTPNFNVTVVAGPPGTVQIVQGNNQSGKPGQTLPLAFLIQVSDGFGNFLPNVPITWTILTPGGITLSQIVNSTDTNGRASALGTLGNIAGNVQVKATAGSVSATFTATVNIPAAGLQKVSGDGQSALINTTFAAPLVVKIVDAGGNGVAGLQVGFQTTSGSGVVTTSKATTDASGQAATTVTAGGTPGPIVVSATYTNFTVTFNLAARLPGPQNVTIVNGASFLGGVSPGAIALVTGNGILPGVQGLFTAFSIIGPLPTTFPVASGLGTGSITFNNIPAPIYYVSNSNGQEQVALQVPFELQPGTVSMTINALGGGTVTTNIQVLPYAPGMFETVYNGRKYAVATRPDGSAVSPSNPARRGENIRIYLTGLGQVTPATSTNFVGINNQTVVANIVVGINNGGVPLIATEYAPGTVGVYIVTLQIPSDTQTGTAQPVGFIIYDASNNPSYAQGSFLAIQ